MADETKNVKISVEDRINSQLLATSAIGWPGTSLDTSGLTEWIEPELLGYSARPTRTAERFELWTLQFNCFSRSGPSGETTHRIWELVDACIAAFDQVTMAVKNWAAADPKPTLFYLRFSEAGVVPVDAATPEDQFLQQLNVTFEGAVIT